MPSREACKLALTRHGSAAHAAGARSPQPAHHASTAVPSSFRRPRSASADEAAANEGSGPAGAQNLFNMIGNSKSLTGGWVSGACTGIPVHAPDAAGLSLAAACLALAALPTPCCPPLSPPSRCARLGSPSRASWSRLAPPRCLAWPAGCSSRGPPAPRSASSCVGVRGRMRVAAPAMSCAASPPILCDTPDQTLLHPPAGRQRLWLRRRPGVAVAQRRGRGAAADPALPSPD